MLALVEPSLARFCIAMKFGIAIAARIPMITTTIISSMSVKPFWFLNMTGVLLLNWTVPPPGRALAWYQRNPDATRPPIACRNYNHLQPLSLASAAQGPRRRRGESARAIFKSIGRAARVLHGN